MPNKCPKCGGRVEYRGDLCGGCKLGTGYINRGQAGSTDVRARAVKAKRNKKLNPINNAKWDARRAAQREAQAHAYFQSLKQQHGGKWPYNRMLSIEKLRDLWFQVFNDKTRFNNTSDVRLHNRSLSDLFSDPFFCGYLGTTMRLVCIECFRWLTKRGSTEFSHKALDKMIAQDAAKKAKGAPAVKNKKKNPDYAKNRPILLKVDNAVIGEPYAKKKLDFGVVEVHNDAILFNVTSLERWGQKALDDVSDKLNERRFPRSLHRIAGAGADGHLQDYKAIEEIVESGGVAPMATLFLTYSFDLRRHLDAGLLVKHNP